MTPADRTRRARLGAYALHASGGTNTAPATAAAERRFYDLVDPNRELSEGERERRAEHARKAHFQRLSAAGVRARQAKAGTLTVQTPSAG